MNNFYHIFSKSVNLGCDLFKTLIFKSQELFQQVSCFNLYSLLSFLPTKYFFRSAVHTSYQHLGIFLTAPIFQMTPPSLLLLEVIFKESLAYLKGYGFFNVYVINMTYEQPYIISYIYIYISFLKFILYTLCHKINILFFCMHKGSPNEIVVPCNRSHTENTECVTAEIETTRYFFMVRRE